MICTTEHQEKVVGFKFKSNQMLSTFISLYGCLLYALGFPLGPGDGTVSINSRLHTSVVCNLGSTGNISISAVTTDDHRLHAAYLTQFLPIRSSHICQLPLYNVSRPHYDNTIGTCLSIACSNSLLPLNPFT